MNENLHHIFSSIFGHAVGDALGVPAEFIERSKLQSHPVADMIGFGSHDVPRGSWSDDTSMELCTLQSLTEQGTIDLDDIMVKFGKWVEDGYMTPQGQVFDIGRTCLRAICNYHQGKSADECGLNRELDNGNGSLMRIIPITLYNFIHNADDDAAIENIHKVSALTHSHDRSCIACGIYDFILRAVMKAPLAASVKEGLFKAEKYYQSFSEITRYQKLLSSDFEKTDISEIKSSGYVVDTLEAAVWCVLTTSNYKDCVLKAVNLGQDTDTVAAVAGGIAGVLYGFESIPAEWVASLIRGNDIKKMCIAFFRKMTEC